MAGEFVELGEEIGKLLEKKNASYGSSYEKVEQYILLLYPKGIRPDQIGDVCMRIREFDKNMRIANDPEFAGEDAVFDKAGYALLDVVRSRKQKIARKAERKSSKAWKEVTGEDLLRKEAGNVETKENCEQNIPVPCSGALQGRVESDFRAVPRST